MPVRIGALSMRGDLWSPTIVVQDLRLLAPDGQAALRLADVEAVITPGSLLPRSLTDWHPHLRRLTLGGVALAAHRDAEGAWQVVGMPRSAGDERRDSAPLIDWLLRQGEIVIHRGRLDLTDARRADAAPIRLQQIELRWRNRLGRHGFELDLTPPADWGGPLHLQGEMREPLLAAAGLWRQGDWSRWRTDLSLHLPDTALQNWQTLLPPVLPPGWTWQGGTGRLALKVRLDKGELRHASLDTDLRKLTLTTPARAASGAPLQVEHLAGRLSTDIESKSWQLQARDLRLQLAGQPAGSPPGTWELRGVRDPQGGRYSTLQADRIDLDTVATLASGLALPPAWSDWLATSRPAGSLQDLTLKWRGMPGAPAASAPPFDWRASGILKGLTLQGVPRQRANGPGAPSDGRLGIPGVAQAELRFDATPSGGQATAAIRDGWLAVPGVFEDERVPLQQLSAELRWRLLTPPAATAPAAVEVEWRNLKLANADLQGETSGRWQARLPEGQAGPAYATWAPLPGQIDLKAHLSRGDATRVHRYLPQALPPGVRHYVRDALRAGQLQETTAQVRGALRDFPYADPARGQFQIAAKVRNATLDYLPAGLIDSPLPWPRFSRLDGDLRFERQGMTLRQASARLADSGRGEAQLVQVEGGIADLGHAPVLKLAGRVQGPIGDLLHYVNHSPIGGWLGHALADVEGGGGTAVDLDLAVPLLDAARTRVSGRLELRGNAVQFGPSVPHLGDVRGELTFDEHGFSLRPSTARALGGLTRIQGGMSASQPLRLTASGSVSAQGLRQAEQLAPIGPLLRQLNGETAYQMQLGFEHGQPKIAIDSPLTGIAVQLPAPLGKPAETALPLRLTVDPVAGPGGPHWGVRLGNRLAARWQGEADDDGPLPRRGWLQVGEAGRQPAPEWPDEGWRVSIASPELSLDAWSRLLDESGPGTRSPAPPRAADPAARSASALDALHELKADVDLLEWQGHHLHQLDLKVRQHLALDGRHWKAEIRSREIAGQVDMRSPRQASHPEEVRARLTRFILARQETPAAASDPAQPRIEALRTGAPRPHPVLPDLDIEVEQFILGKRPMGRLVLQAGHRPGPTAGRWNRDWQIDQLSLQSPAARLSATGLWQAAAPDATGAAPGHPAGSTRLNFKLALDDSGSLLTQLGWPGTLKGGRGTLAGQISWPGTPFEPSARQLGGHLHIDLSAGQFLQADPGVARLLGILSLQSLPRRFLLDFRDVFQQGFGFDHIDGDVDMTHGLARSRNLRIRGAQALILTEGQTDLNAENQDLRVWIVPNLDAGAASLAYAIVNPAVGIGTLIGQWFLRKPLAEAATREFHITGSWDEPVMTPIARENARPAPEQVPTAEAAASQTAGPP